MNNDMYWCPDCGREEKLSVVLEQWTIDKNLQYRCKSCNDKKNTTILDFEKIISVEHNRSNRFTFKAKFPDDKSPLDFSSKYTAELLLKSITRPISYRDSDGVYWEPVFVEYYELEKSCIDKNVDEYKEAGNKPFSGEISLINSKGETLTLYKLSNCTFGRCEPSILDYANTEACTTKVQIFYKDCEIEVI